MKQINREGYLIQRLVAVKIIAQRTNKTTGEKEYLLTWTGDAGELHERWYSESFIQLED